MSNKYYLAKLNIVTSVVSKIIVLLCGLVVPNMLIYAFGSEMYGATVSITHFLAYITLLEGGIGGVARSALYQPLYERDFYKVSTILNELNRFFLGIAFFFIIYTVGLAYSFHFLSNANSLDWVTSFWLVIIISFSTIVQYLVGMKYVILLQSDQRGYVVNTIYMITTFFNVCAIVILLKLGSNLIIVKLFSSMVFVLRPILVYIYVKQQYKLFECNERQHLKQKWTGLGQHIAFFMHSNTAVAILSIFDSLNSVAVFSVYNMVVSQIQNITNSFTAGMEALFGNIIAEGNLNNLRKLFNYFDFMIACISTILFSCTTVLIVPFVKLYTKGINDTNYDMPLLAIVLSVSSMLYCLRLPYHSVIIAAGHFSETRFAAYGEVLINVLLSIVLVFEYGLNGIVFGALVAIAFRLVYYVFYLTDKLLRVSLFEFAKRIFLNFFAYITICVIGNSYVSSIYINNYYDWLIYGLYVMAVSIAVTFSINVIFYKKEMLFLINKILKR